MRPVVIAFACFWTLCLPAGYAQAGPEASACLVRHYAHGFIDAGSGTVVESKAGTSRVLTNWHVASDPGEKITVELAGKAYPATWERANSGLDLALLRVDAALPAISLADSEPPPDTPVRQWGHPGAGPVVPKAGKAIGITGRRAVPGGGEVFEMTIRSQSGDSGAGVFNADGRLVAVCWGTGQRGESCVRLADIKAFLGGSK